MSHKKSYELIVFGQVFCQNIFYLWFSPHTSINTHIMDFEHDLNLLTNVSHLSDICFVVGPDKRKIFAHKVILSRTAYFQRCFDTHWKEGGEGEIVKPDEDSLSFDMMIRYIYSKKVDVTCLPFPKQWIALMMSARQYMLDGLVELCVDHLCSIRDPAAVAEMWEATCQFSLHDDIPRLANHLINNLSWICDDCFRKSVSDEYSSSRYVALTSLSPLAVKTLLQHDHFWVDEIVILAWVMGWAAKQCEDEETRNRLLVEWCLPYLRPSSRAIFDKLSKESWIPDSIMLQYHRDTYKNMHSRTPQSFIDNRFPPSLILTLDDMNYIESVFINRGLSGLRVQLVLHSTPTTENLIPLLHDVVKYPSSLLVVVKTTNANVLGVFLDEFDIGTTSTSTPELEHRSDFLFSSSPTRSYDALGTALAPIVLYHETICAMAQVRVVSRQLLQQKLFVMEYRNSKCVVWTNIYKQWKEVESVEVFRCVLSFTQ
eukprot:GILJ01022562.1.p1 GENE.GILJ01022562.1~~GILJ01022562.1.p1  ORF type:complete len:485 (-),score=39.73 GILJ01022562.1:848-2302(-)